MPELPLTVVKNVRLPYDAGQAWSSAHLRAIADRCLRGLRVLELCRVIAAPVAGKTLAAHGADVLWVTSPNLPSLPARDIDVRRGKRTIQLDLGRTARHREDWYNKQTYSSRAIGHTRLLLVAWAYTSCLWRDLGLYMPIFLRGVTMRGCCFNPQGTLTAWSRQLRA